MQNQKSYDEIMEEQAKEMAQKHQNKKKRVPLVQKDHQHFDSASYEQSKQKKEEQDQLNSYNI